MIPEVEVLAHVYDVTGSVGVFLPQRVQDLHFHESLVVEPGGEAMS